MAPSTPANDASAVKVNETQKTWHYKDPSGKVQGPFSMVQLRKWSNTGYFPADFRIWKAGDSPDDSFLLTDALAGRFLELLPSGASAISTTRSLQSSHVLSDLSQNHSALINLLMEHSISKTNINNSSRRPKSNSLDLVDKISINSLDLVDRISTLPDSILGIILSFIPTKNAVASAVLSKRWKLVWTTVHNLDLCYDDRRGIQDERDDMRFVGFVNHVLLLHDVGWLNKFRLVWSPRCISSHATSWINTAISRNVHELSLRLETYTFVKSSFYRHRTSPEPFVVPTCVFSCNTLRFLELKGVISVSAAIEVCLPKLETINLVSVHFQSQEAFEKLIRGCPVLVNLVISVADDELLSFLEYNDFAYIISSTSLRRLELWMECQVDEPVYINLELEASSLEYLELYGFIPVFLVQKSLSSLVEAKLDCHLAKCYVSDADMCNSVVEAVRVFDCAKALILADSVIWALNYATISLSTEFKRLVKLEAVTYCCAYSSLRDFIQCSDNLEVLTIDQWSTYLLEEYVIHDHSNRTTPTEVPRCFSNSLKKVVFKADNDNVEDELEMIRYMLEHGSALEVMHINFNGEIDGSMLKLVQEISEYPRKSPFCEVKFFGQSSNEGVEACFTAPSLPRLKRKGRGVFEAMN